MSGDREGRGPREGRAPSIRRRVHFAKSVVFASGAILVIGLSLGVWLLPEISGAPNVPSEPADAVEVSAVTRPANGDMWLPSGLELDEVQLAELSNLDAEEQRTWLTDYGAIPLGWRDIELTIKGNRSDPVRVTDVRPVSECSDLGNGSWVILSGPYGNQPDTTRMLLAADMPGEPPLLLDMEDRPESQMLDMEPDPNEGTPVFFEERNITLGKNEEQSLLLSVNSQNMLCSVNLELIMQGDNGKSTQLVFNEGQEVVVGPQNSGSFRLATMSIYAGGEMCHQYVKTSVEIIESNGGSLLNACGAGNLAFSHSQEFG